MAAPQHISSLHEEVNIYACISVLALRILMKALTLVRGMYGPRANWPWVLDILMLYKLLKA